jgi:hypothetical protein
MRIILLFVFMINYLFGFISVNVNKDTITLGEKIEYSINALGTNVEFPNISDIAGFEIEGTAMTQKTNIINGVQTKIVTKTFIFSPTTSTTIPSYSIKVDGKYEDTEVIDITVKKAKPDDNFVLTVEFDKDEVFVNEMVKAKITFKRDKTKPVSNISISKLPFDDFWYKNIGEDKSYESARYHIIEREFILFPQKSGTIKVDSAVLSIITNQIGQDFFGFVVTRPVEKKIFSNENSIKVNPIPNNQKYIGDFSIDYSIDKNEVDANEAVNFTVTIKGNGNIDDIDEIDLNIKGANIFKDEPVKKYSYKDGKYEATYSQKIAIVSDRDFTIEPIDFRFYSIKDKKVKTVSTKKLDIKVKNQNINQQKPTIETFDKKVESTKVVAKDLSFVEKIVYFILGILVSIIAIFIFKSIKKAKLSSSLKIFNKISDREKLKILMPKIKDSSQIDDMIYKLEENIYEGKNHKIILPKELINLDKKENK